ncbi:MAG: hypothetical protein WDN72_04500 [Alphaproteobacteria bacterium]
MSEPIPMAEKSLPAPARSVDGDQGRQTNAPATGSGVAMPAFVDTAAQSFTAGFHSARMFMLHITPRFIVNNSSNIIGFSHVLTEMMMFKSSNKDGKLVQNPKNPINWVWEPFKTVYEDTFRRSTAGATSLKEIFKGNPFKNFYKHVTDLEAATQAVRNLPANAGKPLNEIKLGNSWVARSTLIGLTAWSLSTLIPEKKEKPEEIERMAIMRRVHPVHYVAERLGQALWVPGWREHKRQIIGLLVIMTGFTGFIGSWRNRSVHPVTGVQSYSFNRSYLATSIISLLSGLPLLFASDEQRGYGGYGGISLFRVPFLTTSNLTKYRNLEPGRHWYLGSSVSFQTENVFQALIGGAEKLKDGTIVDHTPVREEAKEKAAEIRAERREERAGNHPSASPLTRVSHVDEKREKLYATPHEAAPQHQPA